MLNTAILPVLGVTPAQDGSSPATSSAQPGFLDTLNQALHSVSAAQGQAATAEAGFSAGVPGATLAKALVANDHAAVAWNATVSVRNELVTAYQSIMNMQF